MKRSIPATLSPKTRSRLSRLAILGALCLCFGLLTFFLPVGSLSGILALPYEPVAYLLRKLSLSGGIGNLFACILYGIYCLLPAVVLLVLSRKGGLKAEDWLLGALIPLLFFVLYAMINPWYPAMTAAVNPMLAVAADSVLVGWLLLRFLRGCFAADQAGLLYAFHWGIGVALGVQVAVDCVSVGYGLLPLFTAEVSSTFWTAALAVLDGAGTLVVMALVVLVLLFTLELAELWQKEGYSPAVVTLADGLSQLCGLTLVVSVLGEIGLNLLNLFLLALSAEHGLELAAHLNTSLHLPLLPLLLVLCALLFARLIRNGQKLQQENDLFV